MFNSVQVGRMGGHLTVGASPESANLRAGSEAHGLTSQQGESFQAMLNEAHFNSSAPPNIVMPWEMPAMSLVFGGPEMPLIPPVRPVLGYVEPTPVEYSTTSCLAVGGQSDSLRTCNQF